MTTENLYCTAKFDSSKNLNKIVLNIDICQNIIWTCHNAADLTMQNNVWLINFNALSPTLAQINLSLEEAHGLHVHCTSSMYIDAIFIHL